MIVEIIYYATYQVINYISSNTIHHVWSNRYNVTHNTKSFFRNGIKPLLKASTKTVIVTLRSTCDIVENFL